MSPAQRFVSRRPGDRGGLPRPASLATSRPDGWGASGRLSSPRTLRFAILVPAKMPLMSFKEFLRRKGEETFPPPLLAGSFTGTMKPSRVELENQTVSFI
jgi:hypothetical protein